MSGTQQINLDADMTIKVGALNDIRTNCVNMAAQLNAIVSFIDDRYKLWSLSQENAALRAETEKLAAEHAADTPPAEPGANRQARPAAGSRAR